MRVVTVLQSPRGVDQKRRRTAALTPAFVDAYGVRPEQVQLFFHEVEDRSWAKAGRLASDLPRGSAGRS